MKKGNSGSSPKYDKQKIIKRIEIFKNIMIVSIIVASICYICYEPYKKNTIYNSMGMSFLSTRVVEYGTSNYDTRNIIENIENGTIKEYTKDVDTSTLGTQQLKFEIEKEDVVKEFETVIEVVDTKNPIIEFKQQEVTIYTGTNYDVKTNILSVKDEVDGDIEFSEEEREDKKYYYKVESNLNPNQKGEYETTVTAYDKNGNETISTYKIKVIERPVRKVYAYSANYTGPATVDVSSVVATALSFVGYRYTRNGASPYIGFDCSGLVKYVYSLHGVNLGHGTTYQAVAGYGVSREEMKPGDIIVWSTNSNNSPTHSAIYIGNGQMVHAANPSTGVIISNVSQWENNGGGHIATIRRV